MAKRTEVESKRQAMLDALRLGITGGGLPVGQKLPALRDLAERHAVSMKVAWECIGQLTEEQLLHTVPRIGTFVGKPAVGGEAYLLTIPYSDEPSTAWGFIQLGFEERIAQLGGVSLRLVETEARQLLASGQLPPLAGLCRVRPMDSGAPWWPASMAAVEFGQLGTSDHVVDKVQFNDVEGGRMATQYLLEMGHTRIAFLGLHPQDGSLPSFYWSRERELGWAQAMRAAGLPTEGLALHDAPGMPRQHEDDMVAGEQFVVASRITASHLLGRKEITAVVAANLCAAEALYAVLSEARIKDDAWPAILSFDDVPLGARSVVSYLRLPWDDVGRAAAQVLWERHTGVVKGPAQQRLVSMRLIPRLSCKPDRPIRINPASTLDALRTQSSPRPKGVG